MTIDVESSVARFAIEAVRRAAKVTRAVQRELAGESIEKDDHSPVTVADFASQAIIARALRNNFPDAILVGEEDSAALRADERLCGVVTKFVGSVEAGAEPEQVCDWIDVGGGEPAGRFWTLDPIDGTKGYLRQQQYAIALALIEDGKVVFGILGCPGLGSGCSLHGNGGVMTLARRGEGSAWAPMDAPGNWTPLHVSDRNDVRELRLLRSVESGHTNIDQMGELARTLGIEAAPVALDSQAKYAVLAAGGGDVLLRLLSPKRPDYREMIWDQAAGSIVVEEAGGRVTDLSGRSLDFSRGRTLDTNSGICATNGCAHDAVLEALESITSKG